jgi:hypothetical protein
LPNSSNFRQTGRAQHTLFSVNPEAPLASLLDGMDNDRQFVGPGPWLAALKER